MGLIVAVNNASCCYLKYNKQVTLLTESDAGRLVHAVNRMASVRLKQTVTQSQFVVGWSE